MVAAKNMPTQTNTIAYRTIAFMHTIAHTGMLNLKKKLKSNNEKNIYRKKYFGVANLHLRITHITSIDSELSFCDAKLSPYNCVILINLWNPANICWWFQPYTAQFIRGEKKNRGADSRRNIFTLPFKHAYTNKV